MICRTTSKDGRLYAYKALPEFSSPPVLLNSLNISQMEVGDILQVITGQIFSQAPSKKKPNNKQS